MKSTFVFLISLASLIFFACKSTRKSNSSATVEKTPTAAAVPTNTSSALFLKPATGIYLPGTLELSAIQSRYPDVSLEKLKEGHVLYSQGPCINCHSAKNIYQYDETKWKNILNSMAPMAKLNDNQKDAVFKYVLAIKAAKSN